MGGIAVVVRDAPAAQGGLEAVPVHQHRVVVHQVEQRHGDAVADTVPQAGGQGIGGVGHRVQPGQETIHRLVRADGQPVAAGQGEGGPPRLDAFPLAHGVQRVEAFVHRPAGEGAAMDAVEGDAAVLKALQVPFQVVRGLGGAQQGLPPSLPQAEDGEIPLPVKHRLLLAEAGGVKIEIPVLVVDVEGQPVLPA